MKTKILVRAPVLSRSGYGEQSRFALRSLRSREDRFDIYLLNVSWGQTGWSWEDNEERKWIDTLIEKTVNYDGPYDVSLQVTIPNEWQKLAPINIGYTAGIETDRVAPEWLMKGNEMDKIIVTSTFAKQGFQETGYTMSDREGNEVPGKLVCDTPIEVVGYPVKYYDPDPVELDLTTQFNFLAVAQWSIRKNVEQLITGFVEEFKKENVGLILKLNTRNNSILDRNLTKQKIQDLLSNYPDKKCQVYLLHGDLTDEQMTYLYQYKKIKSLITLAHGEGFGLPIFEAVYNELPVISPAWSGQVDFLYAPNDKGAMKPMFADVDYDIQQVQPEAAWDLGKYGKVLIAESNWCYPKKSSYMKTLRHVYSKYKVYKDKAKRLKKWIELDFEQEKQYEKFCKVFDVYCQQDNSWMNEIEDIVQQYE
jgi:hypothetical protein